MLKFIRKFSAVLMLVIMNMHPVLNAGPKEAFSQAELPSLETMVIQDEKDSSAPVLLEADQLFTGSNRKIIIPLQVSNLEQLQDILEKTVSIQIKSSGGLGDHSSMSIRGSSSQQVHVYLDGIPLNQGSQSTVDLSAINLKQLEAVEIFQSNAPMRLGSSPMGGAINLISRRSAKEPSGSIQLSGGSFSTYAASFQASLPQSKWRSWIQAEWLESDGDFSYLDNRRTPNDDSDDIWKTRHNNRLEQKSAFVKVQTGKKNAGLWDYSLRILDKEKGLAGRANNQSESVTSSQQIQHLQVSHSNWQIAGPLSKLLIQSDLLFNTDRYQDLAGASGELGLGKQDNQNQTHSGGLNFHLEKLLGDHLLELSQQLRYEAYLPHDNLFAIQPPDSKRQNLYTGIQDTWTLSADSLLDASLRWSYLKNELYRELPGQTTISNNKNEHSVDWHLGASKKLTPSLKIKSNVSRATRHPDFSELFGNRGVVEGNDQLVSERSLNLQMELQWQPEISKLSLIQKPFFSIALFQHNQKNLIQTLYDARGVGHPENIGESSVKGLELEHRSTCFGFLEVDAGVALLEPQIEKGLLPFESGKQIPGIYKRNSYLKLKAQHSSLQVEWEIQGSEEMYYDRNNLIKAADKLSHNAKCSWSYRSMELAIQVKNITEDRQEDFNGWPLPGRSWLMSYRRSF